MSKKWGHGEFWGLDSTFDPDWILTEKQKKLRDDLIELCRKKIRPLAAECDRDYIFPRASLNALTELGLLGLIVPKEFGGLGENHVCLSMVIETIARYGCPSTAMVYTMHNVALSLLLICHHDSQHTRDLLPRLNKEKLVGTLVASDPATGGHFWFNVSSKVKYLSETTLQILKYGSWCTSAGHADWYTISTTSSTFDRDYSKVSYFLIYKDEVRAFNDDWSALGMRGNISGAVIIDGKFGTERVIGQSYQSELLTNEGTTIFLMMTGSCWNGVAMGCMDVAKKHVTRKTHADMGMRICDYPTIQDYFGECICDTNSARMHTFMLAQAMDGVTNNNDWSLHSDLKFAPRSNFLPWWWQSRFTSAKNVSLVADKMLQACGGSGYKTDLGLERLLRDGKAGSLMAPSNEVMRNILGKIVLCGFSSVDIWEKTPNERVIHHELKKMSIEKKKELAKNLLEEVKADDEGKNNKHPFQDTDFENPFNTCSPATNDQIIKTNDGVSHSPALRPDTWVPLVLDSYTKVSDKMSSFVFALPNKTDHTGCFAGQYVAVKVSINGKDHFRYFSPVSCPDDFGRIELILRFETHGIVSQHFQALKAGEKVAFQGPCGGFEYEPNKLDELTLLASGGGITPGMQLIRCIMKNPKDKTKIKVLYYSENHTDLLYQKELDQYAAQDPRLQIVYTVGEAPENWEGEEGIIDTQMIEKYITKPNSLKHKIVMCGGPSMVISCLHSLRALHFPSHFIFIYGQLGTNLVKIVYGRNVQLSGHRCENVL